MELFLSIRARPPGISKHLSEPFLARDLAEAKQRVLRDWFEDTDESLLERHNIAVVRYDDEWRARYERAVEQARVLKDSFEEAPDDGDWG